MKKSFYILLVFLVTGCSKKDTTNTLPKTEDTLPVSTKVNVQGECNMVLEGKINLSDTGLQGKGFVISWFKQSPNQQDWWLPLSVNDSFSLPMTLQTFDYSIDYHITAWAKYSTHTEYGNEVIFKRKRLDTLIGLPVVKTDTGAFPNGRIISRGGSPVTEKGFVINKSGTPTLANAIINIDNGPMANNCWAIDSTIDWYNATTPYVFEENVTYYARPYAVNSTGVGYGSQYVFNTRDPNIKTYNLTKGILIDTAFFGSTLTVHGSLKSRLSIENNMILPTGLNLYAVITDISGIITSNYGNIQVGDTLLLPTGTTGFSAQTFPVLSYVKMNIRLKGTTYDTAYYCNYRYDWVTTNTSQFITYTTPTVYGLCPTH